VRWEKILKPCVGFCVGKLVWSVSSYSEIVNRVIVARKFGRFGVSLMVARSSLRLAYNVLRLGEGGDFTTNVHTKHTLQIYEKLSYEVLNRHFCQTAVISWPSVSRGCKVLVRCEFRCYCRVANGAVCDGCG